MSDNLANAHAEYTLVDLVEKDYLINRDLLSPQLIRMWAFLVKAQREQGGVAVDAPVRNLAELRELFTEYKNQDFAKLDEDYCKMLLSFESQQQYENRVSLSTHLESFRLAYQAISGDKPARLVVFFNKYAKQALSYALLSLLLIAYIFISISRHNWNPLTWNQIKFGHFWLTSYYQDWGRLEVNRNFDNGVLNINGVELRQGLATHANSHIVVELPPNTKNFSGICGLSSTGLGIGRFRCVIKQDKSELYNSGMLSQENPMSEFSVTVDENDRILTLIVNAEDDITYDHAIWANLKAKRK